MAVILKGKPVSDAIFKDLAVRVSLLNSHNIVPTVAILRVGERPDDVSYESTARKKCKELGIRVIQKVFPVACTQEELMDTIAAVNRDDGVHGCLMFRPLPEQLDEIAACSALLPRKDVDGISPMSLAAVFSGKFKGFTPCTAQSCLELLDYYGIELSGRHVVIIGRSLVIGKPVSMLLQNRDATVTMCHRKTRDLESFCRRADILVVAAGKASLVDAGFTNPDQVVIDIGVNAAPAGGICGDVQFDAVAPHVRAISPVPGGLGAVTVAVLCKHVIEAAESSEQLLNLRENP